MVYVEVEFISWWEKGVSTGGAHPSSASTRHDACFLALKQNWLHKNQRTLLGNPHTGQELL